MDIAPSRSALPTCPVSLTINGEQRSLDIHPWVTLLDLLRGPLELCGTKKGCDHGQCGACTVLIDGERLNSCLKLAVSVDGAEITTIEGLGTPQDMHPMQKAFVDHDAFQCGYCTPGQICSAVGLLKEGHAHNRADIRELMSGNLCRCGAYNNIADAVEEVLGKGRVAAFPGGSRMRQFSYTRAETVQDAVAALVANPQAQLLAGGTNLVDLMKYDVTRPPAIVDINRLPLKSIDDLPQGGIRVGALVSNSALAYDERIRERFPLLSSAILAGASPQLRNAATTGGNLLQRTRCYYFNDPSTPCNKREPGSGCSAIGGVNRIHAILGASDKCIAVHPSDMCVALAALDATVEMEGAEGKRDIAFADFHRLPGDHPERDNTLQPGEIVTAIRLEDNRFGGHYTYLKLRDRLSYAFALVSVAAALEIDDEKIVDLRVALGGVAHKPWRDTLAEAEFAGEPACEATFRRLADRLLAGAQGQGGNDFKIPLARKAIIRAMKQAASGRPQNQTVKAIQ